MGWLVVVDISSMWILSLIILGLVWRIVIHRWRVPFDHTHDLDWATVLVYVNSFGSWFIAIRSGRIFGTSVVLLVSCASIILIAIWRTLMSWMF